MMPPEVNSANCFGHQSTLSRIASALKRPEKRVSSTSARLETSSPHPRHTTSYCGSHFAQTSLRKTEPTADSIRNREENDSNLAMVSFRCEGCEQDFAGTHQPIVVGGKLVCVKCFPIYRIVLRKRRQTEDEEALRRYEKYWPALQESKRAGNVAAANNAPSSSDDFGFGKDWRQWEDEEERDTANAGVMKHKEKLKRLKKWILSVPTFEEDHGRGALSTIPTTYMQELAARPET